MYEALVSLLEFFDGLSDTQWFWITGVFVVLFMTLTLDTDWKRRLFETHAEKMKRCPKYRDKYLKKRALRDIPD